MYVLLKACATIVASGMMTFGLSAGYPPASTYSQSEQIDYSKTTSPVSDKKPGETESIPEEKLPEKISTNIPDDATVVSQKLAVTTSGEVKDVETGQQVVDQNIVGTPDKPADPLAKTSGESYIPLPAKDVKEQVASTEIKSTAQQSSYTGSHTTYAASIGNNEYGAYWGTYNNTQAFFESNGVLFAQQARGVIDVSQWQGDIDWNAVRNSGVEGAIIRIGYGWGNGPDHKALRNINECKRLGIPFGVYLYSYAYDNGTAAAEGDNTVGLLSQLGVRPWELSFPVYYDLEHWTWTGHTPPTNPWVYDGIANTWYGKLQAAGYRNLSIYSYQHYLNTALKTGGLHSKTNWVASYGSRPGFSFPNNERNWQYSSSGRVRGINGTVDLNAYGNREYVAQLDVRRLPDVYVPNGRYYINSWLKDSSGIDIAAASTADGVPLQLYSWNNTAAQQYDFERQSDGSYIITNVNSRKVLDVSGGVPGNGYTVSQYSRNNSAAQRWYIRDAGYAYYLQSALGNWVLDLAGAGTGNGNRVSLYAPNGTDAQRFQLASTTRIDTSRLHQVQSIINRNMVLDIPGGSGDNCSSVQLYNSNGTYAQLYGFRQVGNGVYEINNARSGKNVEVAAGLMNDGAIVQQYEPNGTQSQRWLARDYGNGRFAFIGSRSGRALDIKNGQTNPGRRMQIWGTNHAPAQQWMLTNEENSRERLNRMASQRRNDLPDGSYTIASSVNNHFKVDVNAGSHNNSAKVQLFAGNGTPAQRWNVRHDAQGYVTLVNAGSGKVLDISGAYSSNGGRAQQFENNGTYAQKWIAIRQGDGSYVLQSALRPDMVLDLPAALVYNGNGLQIYAGNGTAAQRWRFQR